MRVALVLCLALALSCVAVRAEQDATAVAEDISEEVEVDDSVVAEDTAAATTTTATTTAADDEDEAGLDEVDADEAVDNENVELLSDDAASDAVDEEFDGDYNFLQMDEETETEDAAEAEFEAEEADEDALSDDSEGDDMAFVQVTGGALDAVEEEIAREDAAAALGLDSISAAAEADAMRDTDALLEHTDEQFEDAIVEANALANEFDSEGDEESEDEEDSEAADM